MHHQLHSCEGSINLQKEGEEPLHKTREPTTSSAQEEAGGTGSGGVLTGPSTCTADVYELPPSDSFIIFIFVIGTEPSEAPFGGEGNSFHCCAV